MATARHIGITPVADLTSHLVATLDAALATLDVTNQQLTWCPDASNYAEVELAVRLWASVHADRVRVVGYTTPHTEGIQVSCGVRSVVMVIRPEQRRTDLDRDQMEVAIGERAAQLQAAELEPSEDEIREHERAGMFDEGDSNHSSAQVSL
jgi:hypothetical protein